MIPDGGGGGSFQRPGLDSAALSRLQQDWNWASSQNPMLKRQCDTYPPDTSGLQALAVAVAAAMSNGVTFGYSGDIEDKGSEDLELLAPLLPYANFPAPVLVTLGNEVTYGGPNSDSVWADNVLNALAANPAAAAQFMAQFQSTHGVPLAQYVALGSDHHAMMPTDEAKEFASLITAGTAGAMNVDPKLAAANATSLVQFYAAHPGTHTYGPIEGAYGNIVRGCWPDVMFAITSTAPGATRKGLGPDGMPLRPDLWAAFIGEAMRDPGTAATILVLAHTQAQQWQTLAAQQPGQNGGDSYAFQAGLVNGFFDSQAQTVYRAMGKEWAQGVEDTRDNIADHAGQFVELTIDVVADPGAAAKTVAVDVTKDAFDAIITTVTGKLPTDGGPPPKPACSSWQAGLVNSAKNYDGGSFARGGHIIDPSQLTPPQLQAYNAWLDSPAVINYVENGGQFTSYHDGYQIWVTQNSLNN